MKIRITTDRKPWVNDKPHDFGAEVDAPEADAKALIAAGMAEAIAAPARKAKE